MSKALKDVRNKTMEMYQEIKKVAKRQKVLSEKYMCVEDGDYFSVDGVEFNMSFVFDDITEFEKKVHVMNLYFVDIEDFGSQNKHFLTRNFPSFKKMDDFIVNLRNEENKEEDYISIGKNGEFGDVKSFFSYIHKYEPILELYNSFLDEVEEYAKNQKFFQISDSGIVIGHSNGKRQQEILFKSEKNLFKISINSESYLSQSYARVYIKDDSGWSTLVNKNPKRDYNIDISYKDKFNQNSFSRIIEDFYKVADRI